MNHAPRLVVASGLLLGLTACSEPSIEGRWACSEEIKEFTADGSYFSARADGGFASGIYRREGDLLITKLNRVRNQVPPAERALTSQMLAATGNQAGLAELLDTGFVTLDTPSAGEWGFHIDALDADRLELTHAFYPGRNDERVEPRSPTREGCERIHETQGEAQSSSRAEAEATGSTGPQSVAASGNAEAGSLTVAAAKEGQPSQQQARDTSGEASWTLTSRTCEHTLQNTALYGDVTVALNMVCTSIDTDAKECRSFEVRFPNGAVTTNAELGIPMTDGRLDFHPWTIDAYDETVGGDSWDRWVVSLVEWGGGNRAEERYIVLDREGDALSPLLNPSQWADWRSKRHLPDEALAFEGPMADDEKCTDEQLTGG